MNNLRAGEKLKALCYNKSGVKSEVRLNIGNRKIIPG
jgi:hypothetical protein